MTYPGRRLPYEVRFGCLGEPPPTYISRIDSGEIVLVMSDGAIQTIEFDKSEPIPHNASLFEKLTALSADGIALTNNYKDYYSPAGLMQQWQEEGKWLHPYYEISWRSGTQWIVTIIPPPEIGIRGWQGFQPL